MYPGDVPHPRIVSIEPSGVAAASGLLRPRDVIVSVQGQVVKSDTQASERNGKAGSRVTRPIIADVVMMVVPMIMTMAGIETTAYDLVHKRERGHAHRIGTCACIHMALYVLCACVSPPDCRSAAGGCQALARRAVD